MLVFGLFWVDFHMWYKECIRLHSFARWISSFPNIVCWNDCPFPFEWSWHTCENQLIICVRVISLLFIHMSFFFICVSLQWEQLCGFVQSPPQSRYRAIPSPRGSLMLPLYSHSLAPPQTLILSDHYLPFFWSFVLLGPHLEHMEVPRLGV